MVSNRRLKLNAEADRKKHGYKPQNTLGMRFPEILNDCFKKLWRELDGKET